MTCDLDHVSRVAGVVTRRLGEGFALRINVPVGKREKLAEHLTWLANRHAPGRPEDRPHERIAPCASC